jgi:Kef-type K+ transport system membrane component KefB
LYAALATEQLFVNVVIILVAARLLGELFQRFNLPSLVGELLAGVVIGPSVLSLVKPTDSLTVLSDLGVFFLMFLAGLEMDPREIRKAGIRAAILSSIAFILPLVCGFFASHLAGLNTVQSMFMGLLISVTAVPVTAVVLMEFGMIKTKLASTIITAAVINDILSLIMLSIILQISESGGTGTIDFAQVLDSLMKIAIFIGSIFLVDIIFRKTSHWLPSRMSPIFARLQTKEAAFGILLISTILISLIAQELIGLHFIIGTFFSGLIVYKEIIRKQNFERVYGIISAITFGFFAPIFFAIVGINVQIDVIVKVIPLFVLLTSVAVLSKIGASYLGARLAKFSKDETFAIAFLMNGRGMVELVIATIGFGLGLIDVTLFSIAVLIGFVTTIMAPILSRPYILKIKSNTVTT